jgi:hypothetical protein
VIKIKHIPCTDVELVHDLRVSAAYLTGDGDGQSKEARQGKRQARAQEGGQARDDDKGEAQEPAYTPESVETHNP